MGFEENTAAAPGDASPGLAQKKERAPRSPEQLRAANEKAAVRRVSAKLKDAPNLDALYSKVDELRGKPTEAKKPDVSAGSAQPSQPPGWPSPAAVAALVPDLYIQSSIVLSALPEKYRPPVRVIEIQKKMPDGTYVPEQRTLDPAERLATGVAPVLAKWSEGAQTTPEKAALITLAMVFGPPIVRMAWDKGRELFGAWWEKRKNAPKTPAAQPPARPQLVQGTAAQT